MIRFLTAFATTLVATSALAQELPEPHAALDCNREVPCQIGDRSYHYRLPDGWDGKTPLRVLLHYHGWARQGTLIVKHGRIAGATKSRNVLLLAPNGRNKTWDFWGPNSDDSEFGRAVLDDAAKRFPIDPEQIYVSGYSYGSAMAWRFACEEGHGIRALLAVSGTIDQDEICSTAPPEIRHVHGTSDTVMDFPFGPGGDTTYPVHLWREHHGCEAEATETSSYATTEKDIFERSSWACDGGLVTLDVHARGHFIPRGWFAHQLDELIQAEGS